MADLGSNIRHLREAFGETQLELAQALGYESPATISMYESGSRGQQNFTVISNIAYHYRVTEEQLIYEDFSDWDAKAIPIENSEFMRKVQTYMLPIFSMEDEDMDAGFREGILLHSQALERIRRWEALDSKEILAYIEPYQTSESPVAAANIVWWLFYYGLRVFHGDLIDGVLKVQSGELKKEAFLKEIYLRDISAEENERLYIREEARVAFFSEFDRSIRGALRTLYRAPDWRDVAEYYAALQYLFGFVDNGHRVEDNTRIGKEMMQTLVEFANPYVIGYLKLKEQLHKV